MTVRRTVLMAIAAVALVGFAAPVTAQNSALDAGPNWRSSAKYAALVEAMTDEASRLTRELNQVYRTNLTITLSPDAIVKPDLETGWTELQNRLKFRYQYITPLERVFEDMLKSERYAKAIRSQIKEIRIVNTHGAMFPEYSFRNGVLTMDVIMSRGQNPDRGPMELYNKQAVPKLRRVLEQGLR